MKKLLSLLLAICMAFSLCACGSKPGPSVAVGDPQASPDNVEVAPSYDDGASVSDKTSADSEVVNAPTDNAPATNMPAEAITPAETPDQPSSSSELTEMPNSELIVPDAQNSDPVPAVPDKPKGLIIMTTSAKGSFSGSTDIAISSIDVDTGDVQAISKFTVGIIQSNGTVISYHNSPEGDGSTVGGGYYATRREWFDDDYDRMAITWVDNVGTEVHAGWLDANGEFFDVTVALGLEAKSDFDPPTKQYAIGFSEDGYFIYQNLVGSGPNSYREACHVPLNNLSADAVETGIRLIGAGEDFQHIHQPRFSDYDSVSGRLLLNTSESISHLCVSPDDAGETYVPGDSRLSWNGVFSPDDSSVAFMSKQKGGGVVDIYTMPLSGGDPAKINTDSIDLAGPDVCEKGCCGSGEPCSMLIDWE